MTYHTKTSYLKSIIRIIGYLVLFFSIPLAAFILIISEFFGIFEEMIEEMMIDKN